MPAEDDDVVDRVVSGGGEGGNFKDGKALRLPTLRVYFISVSSENEEEVELGGRTDWIVEGTG